MIINNRRYRSIIEWERTLFKFSTLKKEEEESIHLGKVKKNTPSEERKRTLPWRSKEEDCVGRDKEMLRVDRNERGAYMKRRACVKEEHFGYF